MSVRYPRTYALLRAHGHSAVKSLEVIIDARRGSPWAINWIRLLRTLER